MSFPTARSPSLIPRSPSPYGNPNIIRAPSPNRPYGNPIRSSSPNPYGNPNVGRAPSPNPYARSSSPNPYGRSSSPNPYGRSSSPNPYGNPNLGRVPSPNPYGNPNLTRSPPESTYRKSAAEGFEFGRNPRSAPADLDPDLARDLQASVDHLLLFKARPSAVSGSIPVEALALFYHSKNGNPHSLDLPLDADYANIPELDNLVASCRPHETVDRIGYAEREPLFYPTKFPWSSTFDITSFPVLDAVRESLLPTTPPGYYLTTVRDRLEVLVAGARLPPQSAYVRSDGRLATIIITLPSRFRGGATVVRDNDGKEDRFTGRGGEPGRVEWMAFLGDCDYQVEPITKGCRLTLSYAVLPKTFGIDEPTRESLALPSDPFFDLIAPILNQARGRKVGFFLAHDYKSNPADSLAEALIPKLKGGDALLFQAFRSYKLRPDLHWTAGGYIWPVNRFVEWAGEVPTGARVPPVRGTFSAYPDMSDHVRTKVESSGAIPLANAGIQVLTDWNGALPIGKEKVSIVSGGVLEKLVVNVLVVVFIP